MSKVRIVGGTWRSRLIEVPDAMGLRPTPDRVRETLFNWLGQDLEGKRCLDLFSGSGALGFEAASRGAAQVVMVENAPRVYAHLQQTAATLKADNVRLVRGDALNWLKNNAQQFDVIFLDPPYRQGWLERIAPLLPAALAPEARVYAEAEYELSSLDGAPASPWQSLKSGRAGQVHYGLFCFEPSDSPHADL